MNRAPSGFDAKTSGTYNEPLKLGHTDTMNLKKVLDQYRKATFIEMETLLA
jgi:hypothetical protein